MCLLTTGGLGIGFAVAKTITAFAIGIFGGLATRAVIKAGGFASPLKAKNFRLWWLQAKNGRCKADLGLLAGTGPPD